MGNFISFDIFLTESIVDIPKGNLDQSVFQFDSDGSPPKMITSIKKQIEMDLERFQTLVMLEDVYIVGSILTKYYTQNSDIDVNMVVSKTDIDDVRQGKILLLIKELNGKLAVGTTHPINYYILLDNMDETKYDGIYNFNNDQWTKLPVNIDFNLSQYLNNFHKIVGKIDLTLAQLRRDIIDYDALSEFSDDDVNNLQTILKRKLFEITEKIETLVDIKNNIKKRRKQAFQRPMTPEEIQHYKTKNMLPENVVEKLLQKYYYWDFIVKLEKIIDSRKILGEPDAITPDELQKIKQIQQNTCVKSFEGYTNSSEDDSIILEKVKSVRKIKLKKMDWKNPKKEILKSKSKAYSQKMNRGMDRKHLNQVSYSQDAMYSSMGSSNMGSAKRVVDIAKNSPSGIWRITPSQVKWLAIKYHHIPPDQMKPIKHLGNTGIVVWRKGENNYFLVKHGKMGY